MTSRHVQLALHTYSFENHFRYKEGFDAFEFMRQAKHLGVAGVHISMNDENYRWVGGTSRQRLSDVGAAARELGLYLESDTSSTDPDHLTKLMHACRRLGADRLRTYTTYEGLPAAQIEATVRDLRDAAPVAADLGISILLENHEDFTGGEVRQIIESVDHPSVRALFDFGNSMMVLEEPLEAAHAMAPFIEAVHLKDHVLVLPPNGSSSPAVQPIVCGVPIGRGRIDVAGILAYLLRTTSLSRVCIQSVYGFSAPVARNVDQFAKVRERSETFRPVDGPWDESLCLLDHRFLAAVDLERLLNFELAAVAFGVGKLRSMLWDLGFESAQSVNGPCFRPRSSADLANAGSDTINPA